MANSKDCDCDDGIGFYVCAKHATPENDVFYYALGRHLPEPELKQIDKQDDEE